MPHLTREADGEAGLCAARLRVEVVSVAEELGGGGGGAGVGRGVSVAAGGKHGAWTEQVIIIIISVVMLSDFNSDVVWMFKIFYNRKCVGQCNVKCNAKLPKCKGNLCKYFQISSACIQAACTRHRGGHRAVHFHEHNPAQPALPAQPSPGVGRWFRCRC